MSVRTVVIDQVWRVVAARALGISRAGSGKQFSRSVLASPSDGLLTEVSQIIETVMSVLPGWPAPK